LKRAAEVTICIVSAAFCLLPPVSASPLPLYRDSLPNGLIVLTYEDHRLPMAVVAFVCRSGSAQDPEGKFGVAALTANLLTRGAGGMSGDSVTSIVDLLGAGFTAFSDRDFVTVRAQVLSKDVAAGLELVANAVLEPAFDAREFATERDRNVTSLRMNYDVPMNLARREFVRLVFPNHPYGHTNLGDTAMVAALSPDDCRLYHQTHFLPNNCFLIAVGDLKRDSLLAQVQERFGAWSPAPKPELRALPPDTLSRLRVRLIFRSDARQTVIEFGHPGISGTAPDLLPLRLGNHILGGSPLASRLGQSVREKGGLAYDVRCWFDEDRLTGAFHATVQTAKPREAIARMFSEIESVHDQGVRAAELEDARSYFTGSYPLSFGSSRGKVNNVAEAELNHWPMSRLEEYPERIRAVTLDEVNQALREHLRPGKYLMVVVGNVKKEDLGLDDAEWIE
jgi:zinc protease